MLFLTATPLQLGSDDLFVILNVLRPDLIIDRESFNHMAAPNPHIKQAVALIRTQPDAKWKIAVREEMTQAANTAWGRQFLQDDPEFQRIFDLLGSDTVTPEQRVDAISSLERLHTFSGIVNRTRRRDIGQFTIRRPETVEVAFTPQQAELHDEILRIQATILRRLHGDRSVKFLMTTIRRQAASCLFGLIPMLEEILTRRLGELGIGDPDDTEESLDGDSADSIRTEIADVLAKAKTLPPPDPKLDALVEIVRKKQILANNKLMVFSTFRHTLAYLNTHTRNAGLRVGMVHGGTPDEDRVDLRNRFRLPKDEAQAIDVLLFSEVGCEGLDYEFCDCMVNYDLPWNPMRVEQRIGRIDRRGQKSDYVSIFNMVTPGTVDAEIYQRCLLRIGVFNQEIGASEEILGQITRQIRDIAEDLTLTPSEQAEKLQQLADNEIRLIQQQQELEDKQHEFFGLRLPERQTECEIADASSFWLSSKALQNLVDHYLRRLCGDSQDFILGEKPLKTLRVAQEGREKMLQDFRKLPRQKGASYRQWENWLKGSEPHLPITFESTCAVDQPQAVLVTPLHPLVRQAANVCNPQHRILIGCSVGDSSTPPGDYPFAIYRWRRHGLREDIELHSVGVHPLAGERVMALLAAGDTKEVMDLSTPSSSVLDQLEGQHYSLWLTARNQHRERVQQLAAYRRESLNASQSARVAILREQLNRATDEKIRRMRQSQIATAESDFQRHAKELDDAIQRADITSQLVAQGVLRVRAN